MNSWNLGKVLGIQIRIHWTFLLLPVWIFSSAVLGGLGVASAISTVIFVFAIFGCVLLHELGHAMAARQFNIPTRDIVLLPIGGVASLERMPRNPWQELWIAAAGPLVNVAIASVILPVLWLFSVSNGFWFNLALANIALVIFNLIPAFPMDGGRILRSTLALCMDWLDATKIAVVVGKISAVALGCIGLANGQLMLIFIGVFVYFAAHAERIAAVSGSRTSANRFNGSDDQRSRRSDAWSSGHFSRRQPETVPSTLSVKSVMSWLSNRKVVACNVVEAGRSIGTITRSQLMDALARGLGNEPVGRLLAQGRSA